MSKTDFFPNTPLITPYIDSFYSIFPVFDNKQRYFSIEGKVSFTFCRLNSPFISYNHKYYSQPTALLRYDGMINLLFSTQIEFVFYGLFCF